MRNAVVPRKVSFVNPGKIDELRFDLLAQTAQVDHSVSSAGVINEGARVSGHSCLIELAKVRDNSNYNAIRRAWPVRCLTLLLARQSSKQLWMKKQIFAVLAIRFEDRVRNGGPIQI